MASNTQQSQAKTFYDFLGSFESGVNMGIEPLLLPKNQLAEGRNISVRGAYVTHRPPHMKAQFVWPDPATQAAFEQGLFQGAGYYRPDFGTAQLIVSISGHIYSLTETGGAFVVADISIAGDLNDAAQHQAWMWQAEKWLIISDGTGTLPIFYDGTICRRSYGPSGVLAIAAASGNFPSPRVIGETLTINLTANYTGPYDVPVIFNGAFYQTKANLSGYAVILTNVGATVGANEADGSSIMAQPSYVGLITNSPSIQVGVHGPQALLLQFAQPSGLTVGDVVTVTGFGNWTVYGVNQALNQAAVTGSGPNSPGDIVPAGTLIQKVGGGPAVLIGLTIGVFVNPAVGATVNVSIDRPYSGASGQTVWIGTEQYTIAPSVPGASATIFLVNLSDTANAGGAIPTGSPGGDILSVPEIPACRMGAYGMGRNAFSHIDGISFDYGDIVGGAAGTQANSFRDSVLKMTESTFQSGGGSFRLPGSGDIITSMVFGANLDVSLGQGPLQVGTANSMFTCTVAFDRSTWATTTNPILTEALIGNGPQGQWSTTLVNSDIFFRSSEGEASLVQARRDFFSWGNVPISQEMRPVYDADNQTLLQYGSKVDFDNRALETVNPVSSAQGIYHDKLVSMSFDTISNLRTKLPPVYEGTWEGLNILQTLTGNINGRNRCFAFVLNTTSNKIELYEILRQATTTVNDNGTDRITWQFDTPIVFNKDIKGLNELVRLMAGEIYTKDVQGTVDVEVQYRPDFNPAWTSWRRWTMTPATWKPRIGFGEPSDSDCEQGGGGRKMRVGYFFQLRFIITGHCKVMGCRVNAVSQPEVDFATPICT